MGLPNDLQAGPSLPNSSLAAAISDGASSDNGAMGPMIRPPVNGASSDDLSGAPSLRGPPPTAAQPRSGPPVIVSRLLDWHTPSAEEAAPAGEPAMADRIRSAASGGAALPPAARGRPASILETSSFPLVAPPQHGGTTGQDTGSTRSQDRAEWDADQLASRVRGTLPRVSAPSSDGARLDPRLSAYFEPIYGSGVSEARLHVDEAAARSADAAGAAAYARGRDVYFGRGRYTPETVEGRAVLAHELAHTVLEPQGTEMRRITDEHLAARVEPAPEPKVARLHIFADVDVAVLGFSDLKGGNVGHSWVSLQYLDPTAVPPSVPGAHRSLLSARSDPFADPMGFWPDVFTVPGQGGYSTDPRNSYVPGHLLHPDREHEGREKAVRTYTIDQPQVDAVVAFAESKRGAQYSVYFYNCTTFARDAVTAAGQSAPSASTFLDICYPNRLYDGIKANQEAGVGTTEVKDLETKSWTRVDGSEPKKYR
jgi:hypothetical protein